MTPRQARIAAKHVLCAVLSLALPVVAFGGEPQPDQALVKAEALFDAGKWSEADCILGEYSKRHPAPSRLSAALVLQGRCREKRGDFAAAQKLYGRVAHDDAMLRKDPEAVAAAYDRLQPRRKLRFPEMGTST